MALTALLLLSWTGAGRAAVSAHFDRDTAQLGQPLTLTIESDDTAAGRRPELAPLRQDFELLGTSTSREIRIVDGQRSDRMRWVVQLLPRHAGSLAVPPLAVGNEQTAALTLSVAEAQAGGTAPGNASSRPATVFIEVDSGTAGKPVYVQQQIPYTVRLYYDASVQSGELSAPASPDAVVEQLGKDQRSTATVHGRDYNVIERHYAISPEKSGTLQIAPSAFRGSATLPQDDQPAEPAQSDPWTRMLRGTPFANDPMFRNGGPFGRLAAATHVVAASAGPLVLTVRPRPAAAGGQWLPAEQITLHDSWASGAPAFRVGQPVTRTITIEAKGLAASQIPPIALAEPANTRLYPETPENQSRTDGTTVYGISKQRVTYLPGAAGTLEVAPVELAWWDTRADVQRHAELPGRRFNVAPGAAAATPAPASPSPSLRRGVVATPSADGASSAYPGPSNSLRLGALWAAAVLALLLAFAAALLFARRRQAGNAAPRRGHRAARRALRQACQDGDRAAAARALLDLACIAWPDSAPRGLSDLASRLAAGADEVRALDRSLYAATDQSWDGVALWRAVAPALRPRRGDPARHDDDGLAALYP